MAHSLHQPVGARSVASESERSLLQRLTPWWHVVAIGVAGFLISAAGSWRPSFWVDESATISSANRPAYDLGYLVIARADAVHGLYYFFMNGWFRVFGISELSARLPSAIAVGIAAGGLVVLGTLVSGRRVGVVAGLIFVVLPRTTWAGTEARSYAMCAAAAVLLTIAFVLAVRERTPRRWTLYAVGVVLSLLLFIYLATVVVAHLVTLLVNPRTRQNLSSWVPAAGLALLVSYPFIHLARSQSGQLDWIPAVDWHVFRSIFEYQWFPGALLLAVVAHLLVLAALTRQRHEVDEDLLTLALPWALVPTGLVLTCSVLIDPIYLDRYLTFGAPAVALLLGFAVCKITTDQVKQLGVVSILGLLALPAYIDQRRSFAEYNGTDFSQTADYVQQHAAAGDCIVYDTDVSWLPGSMRAAQAANPDAFTGLVDVGLRIDRLAVHDIFDRSLSTDEMAARTADCPAIWVLTDIERTRTITHRHTSNQLWTLPPNSFESDEIYRELVRHGFGIESRHAVNVTQVVRMVPDG